jgi:hypothetical protein
MKRLVVSVLAVFTGFAFTSLAFAEPTVDNATKAATDAAQEKVKATGSTMKEKANKAVTEKSGAVSKPEKKGEKHAAKEAVGPCRQIREICKDAGFVLGEYKEGIGLYRDCINPIMQGKKVVHGIKKPLPSVDPKLIAECKKKAPDFGSGKVGYK